VNVGNNSSTYANASLTDNDTVSCVLISSESCALGPDTSMLSMSIIPAPVASVTPGPISICQGDSAMLNCSPIAGVIYQWQLNGANIPGANGTGINAAQTGNYSVIVSNACGADTSSLINVSINPSPTVDAGDSVVIYPGETANLNATSGNGVPPFSYSWSPTPTLDNPLVSNPNASPMQTTTYTVIITDANGCTSSDTVTVYVEYTTDIYLPTGFSPNGDNQNDVLYVRGHGIKSLDLIIYDRWGEKIFETNKQGFGWDGSYKGKALEPAVFVYYLNAVFYNNEKVFKKGNITLVR
jgi:gliding motility-associated-like protein